MASQAINAKSFCNYVVSLCTYLNGNALSSANKTQLYNYLIEGVTPSTAINIKTALAILNKINTYASSAISISVSGGTLSSILSLNTAKALINKALPSGNRAKFCTLNMIYDNTGNLNTYNYMKFIFYLAAPSSTSYTLTGTLYGAGGGGGGAISGDNGKQNVTNNGGSGYAGGNTTFVYTPYNGSSTTTTATGGSGGGVNSYYHEGNAPYCRNGYAGSAGSTKDINTSLASRSTLTITPGYGGSGGGGCATKIDWGGTVTAGNATSSAGGNGAASNSWSGEDWAYGCGGGAGSGDTPGTSYKSAPSGTPVNGSYSEAGVGGKGGYADTNQTAQPKTIGAGGLGGLSSYQDDVVVNANGGNGGNNGSFKLTGGTAASALFIWKQ